MSPGQRLLSLTARLPGTLLPFAAGLALSPTGLLYALAAAIAALTGWWISQAASRWLHRRMHTHHLLLCSAVLYVVAVILLLVAAEQHAAGTAAALSLAGGLTAPAERVAVPHPRLDRTALAAAVVISLICGAASAWSVPLVAAALAAAISVPLLVMTRGAGEKLSDPETP
ncbi:hypothetical protein [Nesterenkonia sp.]|uniref:hypothetical protein n=1 Tax=Nesterenkonia sp. TaxID=704201 RepID=UPI0026354829|nr:hypothetical protein [Nesterenkonia sp.]